MNRSLAALLINVPFVLIAQGPPVTSWIVNPGSETGYGGILSNVETVSYTATDVYVACTCIPGYDIGPWAGNPNTPANQNFIFKITRDPVQNTGTPVNTGLGHIGVWRNGVSIFNAKDAMSYNNQGIWNRDALVFEGASFDACLGHPAPNGEYHHHVNPTCLYDDMDDTQHSDLIGYAFDGFPIYGAYAFTNADGTGPIIRMRTSYRLRTITDRTTLPDGTVLNAGQYGPAIGGQYPLGAFLEDYEYVANLGELDSYNGRFSITPEYPEGIYAYFVSIDEQGAPAYPYVLGPQYFGTVQAGNTGPQSGHNTVPGGATVYDPTSTGIAPVTDASRCVLYPVPAAEQLLITVGRGTLSKVVLMDTKGGLVQELPVNGTSLTVDLGAVPAGTYTAQILLGDGTRIMRPFIRQ